MAFSWSKSLLRSCRARRERVLRAARTKTIRLQLEGLEERCVPSASTIAATQVFTTGANVPAEVSFQLDQSGNVWEFNPTLAIAGANPNLTQISTSQTGIWSSIAATTGADGNPVLFAISRTDGSLWEHSLVFGDKKPSGATAGEGDVDTNWRQISNGGFTEISATDAATGVAGSPTGLNPVVFAIVDGGTLWEHNIGFGDKDATGAVSEGELNGNWRQLSSGQFTEIAAASVFLPTQTQNSGETGVPANPLTLVPADPIVFGVMAGSGNVWEHNANPGGSMAPPSQEGTIDANWSMITTGSFTDLAAVVDPTVTTGATPTLALGRPVLYAIASGSGNVWEHNIAMSNGAAPEGTTDANWALIYSKSASAISATIDIEPAAGSTPLTANPILFASASSGGLFEHNALFTTTGGEFTTDANWSQISNGTFEQISSTLHATATGGTPAVFAITGDFNLWEHLLAAGGTESMIDANWSRLSTAVSFAGLPLATLPATTPASTSSPLISLILPPLDINLLGLEVQTSGPIKVNVSAQPGAGELLGNLLTDASNLLNIQGVNNALNNVLGSVVTLVNSASLSVTGVASSDLGLLNAAAETTPVLDLFVAPVHLNLLGALVDTSPIHLTITAHSGPGLVLGNVVADLANLFNPPLPAKLDLDTINAKLVALLGELNQQIPGVGGNPTPVPTTATAWSEQVVSLAVPPINLNLLGLNLQTSQIQVNANAQTGNGDLLGNVLTTLLNTLGATPQNLSELSGNLNALLSKVVGVLNASALTLPSDAVSSLSGVLQQLALPNLVNATGTASAPILNLAIASTDGTTPPVNVNLLGLQVTTSNIQAQLLAQTGDGQILGNLLYNVANLLNPGGSISLLTILGSLGV